jgi:hypothetical protein
LDHWFYSKADSDQSPRLSAMTSCEWSSLAAKLGQERVPLSDVEVLTLVMQDVRGGASARTVSDQDLIKVGNIESCKSPPACWLLSRAGLMMQRGVLP